MTKLATGEAVPPQNPQNNFWASNYDDRNDAPTPTQEEQVWPTEQEPPANLQWPEPQEPVPEWQIQAQDEEPLAENDQVYQDNIALARLNKRANNGANDNAFVQRSMRGSEDMEMSSDDENNHHYNGANAMSVHEGHRPKNEMSVQDRLLSLAGQAPLSQEGNWRQPPPNVQQNFNRPPPPMQQHQPPRNAFHNRGGPPRREFTPRGHHHNGRGGRGGGFTPRGHRGNRPYNRRGGGGDWRQGR